jgi:hypothetical protein
MKLTRPIALTSLIALGLLTKVTLVGLAGQGPPPATSAGSVAERFEVASIKAVRPTLVNTVSALQKQDVAAAKAAFDAFDSAWNGIEVYINTRNPEMYTTLEANYESRLMDGLKAPSPNTAALLADAQAMLAKFDEAVHMVEQAAPLNRLYDDLARLRIVRAHLREVTPALKAGDIAKARDSFGAFDDKWDSIEDLVKDRSREAYVAIEAGMIQIERALMSTRPDVDEVIRLVTNVMDRYNTIVAQVTRDARNLR